MTKAVQQTNNASSNSKFQLSYTILYFDWLVNTDFQDQQRYWHAHHMSCQCTMVNVFLFFKYQWVVGKIAVRKT